MSEGQGDFKNKIEAANEKLNKALTEAIAKVKEVIATKNSLYSVDVEDLDFEALKKLEVEYKNASDMASKALSMREQVKFASKLDKSITNIEKTRDLSAKLVAIDSPEAQESVVKEINTTLKAM